MNPIIANPDTVHGILYEWFLEEVRRRPKMWNRLVVFTDTFKGEPGEPTVYHQYEVDPDDPDTPIGEPLLTVHAHRTGCTGSLSTQKYD
jgi:hypothetical protein